MKNSMNNTDRMDADEVLEQAQPSKFSGKKHYPFLIVFTIIGITAIIVISMLTGYLAQKDSYTNNGQIIDSGYQTASNNFFDWISGLLHSNDVSQSNYVNSFSGPEELSDYLIYLVDTPTSAFDSEYIAELRAANATNLYGMSSSFPAAYEFLRGFEDIIDHNDQDAFSHLQKCFNYYEDNASYDLSVAAMYARCSYELARLYSYKGSLGSEYAVFYFDYTSRILKTYEIYDLLVYYDSWIVSEGYNIENSSDYLVTKATEMVEIAEKTDYSDLGYVYTIAANAFNLNGDATNYIHYLMMAIDAYTGLRDENGNLYDDNIDLLFCYTSLGNEYSNENNNELAIEYLTYANELPLNMEQYYSDYADYPEYYEQYKAELKSYVLQNLAFALINSGDTEAGYHYIEEVQQWILLESDTLRPQDTIALNVTIASYYSALGEDQRALDLLYESLEDYNAYDDFMYVDFDLSVYTNLAAIYEKIGDYDMALTYYSLVQEQLDFRGRAGFETYLDGLYRCYRELGNESQAIYYADAYIEYLESHSQSNTSTQAAYLTRLAELKDAEIRSLESQSTYYYIIIIIGAILLVMSVTFSLIFVHTNRKIRQISNDFKHLSETDSLTDLYNRRTLDTYLEANWDTFRNNGQLVAIAMMDVDFFKSYNDHYGHQLGDEALLRVAEVIRQGVAENDFVARYGGEEFLAVLVDTDGASLRSTIDRIQSTLDRLNIPHDYSSVSDHITISVGCYLCSPNDDCANYEDAIHKADEALYQSKVCRNTATFLP